MQQLKKNNKTVGIYWLKESLENVTIVVKVKSKEEIMTLPKFDEYKDRSYEENIHVLNKTKINEYKFKWQEKMFSTHEFQKYSDTYNCSTETELKYHDMIKDPEMKPQKVFTYVNEDYHLPLPVVENKNKPASVPKLNTCFEKLNINSIGSFKNDSTSVGYLFKSQENISDHEQWVTMHVVLDNSEYNEESQILFKQEYNLVSLYHNITQNYLMVVPDVNNLHFNPYNVEDGDNILGYEYGVDIDFGKEEKGEDMEHLLNNLLKKWEKKKKQLLNFEMPPLGMKKTFITFEIVSAFGFEMDNMYIEFQIKIPDDITVNGDRKGRTHVSKSSRSEDDEVWRFGHVLELELEYATGIELSRLKVVLEAISVDWWGRHRTEGYSCLTLTLEPGEYKQILSCSRPEELDVVEAESRRFFVGGCHLIKDLDVLINPQMHEANFRYVSSGKISVLWRTLSQTQSSVSHTYLPDTSTDLLKGAEAVLKQYKKAKATLAAATKSFTKPEEQ
ncbi:unnamed protein product [Euphydryas editha]|uniref:Uncharacterized protein n=1 Tax=Euphydryas editha TaxID=104508 RepID=A0AAU9U317_EUPED|nr:unnamed protein product [Euphydryas editha]